MNVYYKSVAYSKRYKKLLKQSLREYDRGGYKTSEWRGVVGVIDITTESMYLADIFIGFRG